MGVCCAGEDSAQPRVENATIERKPQAGSAPPKNPYLAMYENEEPPVPPAEMKLAEGDGTPKLYYMDSYGRAEPIRMVLEWGKVEYEDIRFTFMDFRKWIEAGVFPNNKMPFYIDESGRQFD